MNPKNFPYLLKNITLSYKPTPKLPNYQLVQQHLKIEDVLLLYGAKDQQHNQAVVLYNFVKKQLK